MIPLIPVAILGGTALVLLIGALILRQTRLVERGIPIPVACLILGLLLVGGIAFVSVSNREPEKPPPSPVTDPPPEMAAMARAMGTMGMQQGSNPPRDPKRPVVVFVQKLAAAVQQESFQLAAKQRAEMKPKLSDAASAEQMPPQDAVQLEESLRSILTDEQRKQVDAATLDRSGGAINYTADFNGNPFREGPPKESMDKLLEILGKDEP